MKKLFYSLMAAAALLTSCSSDEDFSIPAGDGDVTFTVTLPEGINTRAYADGNAATKLDYAVYLTGTDEVITSSLPGADKGPDAVLTNQRTFTLTLPLAKGKTYDLVFFASNPKCSAYTFDAAGKSVSIDYKGIKVNDESRDAFFQAYKGLEITGPVNKEIPLYRPFAQINIGTDDIEIAKKSLTELGTTNLTVDNIYSKFNLFTGEASEPVSGGLTFDFNGVPSGEKFPVTHPKASEGKSYDYLSMNYLLTGAVPVADPENAQNICKAERELVNVKFSILDKDSKKVKDWDVPNVPVQRNYRTNIYGSLLTSTATLNVTIEPAFDGVYNNTVVARTANDVVAFLSSPLYSNNNFADTKLVLGQDIDMTGKELPAVASYKGAINGDGHALKNLKIIGPANTTQVANLIQTLDGATVENIKFESMDIECHNQYGAALFGTATNGTKLTDVTISGTVVNDYSAWSGTNTAALVNKVGTNATLTNCTNNATVSGTSYTAGITTNVGANSTLKNCTNNGAITGSSSNTSGIATSVSSNATIDGCKNTATISGTSSVAGIATSVAKDAKLVDCTNSGEIKGTGSGNAGIVVSISNGGLVEGCTNTGAISGTSRLGGIVSSSDGDIKKCTNEGDITGNKPTESYVYTGGIVGELKGPSSGWLGTSTGGSIDECTNKGNVTVNSNNKLQCVGGVVGMCYAKVTNSDNYGSVTCAGGSQAVQGVGGVVGELRNDGYVNGCENHADVTISGGNAENMGAGGIVGWMRYYNGTKCTILHEVSGCVNDGSIIAEQTTGVGGIVGLWYQMGKVDSNTNKAPKISGASFVAGLVGGYQMIHQDHAPSTFEQMFYLTKNTSTTTLANIIGTSYTAIDCYDNGAPITRTNNTLPQ